MSLHVVFDPGAKNDLLDLEDYLADRFSAVNALAYVNRIIAACNKLGLAPYRGTKRDDLQPGVRNIGFERRVTITYQIKANAILVLGIFYGG